MESCSAPGAPAKWSLPPAAASASFAGTAQVSSQKELLKLLGERGEGLEELRQILDLVIKVSRSSQLQ